MIKAKELRVINSENEQLGVISARDARNLAYEAGLDLVEVSPNAEPPVCRIMDYGKWQYQQKRKERLSQKKQHVTTMKEVRFRPEIDDHDRDIKVNRARKFLEKGHRVQFTILFRGREMMHKEHGYDIMEHVKETLGDLCKIERPAKMAGRRMTMVVMSTVK